MKKPKNPPNYWDSYYTHKENFIKIISTVTSPLYKGKYLHWDDFIHKKMEGELSSDEYWYGLSYRRNSAKRDVPLFDKTNQLFGFVLTNDILHALHKTDSQTAGSLETFFPSTVNTEDKDKYIISSLIEEAITSSQIEGAITTRKVAKEMIKSGRSPKDIHEKMILNNYLVMKKIMEIKNEKLTPELILEIHEIITKDTLQDQTASGRFRTKDEEIDIGDEVSGETYHIPPHADELSFRIDRLCKFANNEMDIEFIHPVIRAIIIHFSIAYDHPFIDGNGRTARALFYWSMLHSGYWMFEYLSISQAIRDSKRKYYKSFLHTETDHNDLTYFIIYHLEVIDKSIKALGKYLERKTKEIVSVEKEISSLRFFNHRQKALLNHAMNNPQQTYSFQSHAASHNTARQTARTDILELEKYELLVSGKGEKRRTFHPAENLRERLVKFNMKKD